MREARRPHRKFWGLDCSEKVHGSAPRQWTGLFVSHAFGRSPAEPWKVSKMRNGFAARRNQIRFTQAYDGQSFASCNHGRGDARSDGGNYDDGALIARRPRRVVGIDLTLRPRSPIRPADHVHQFCDLLALLRLAARPRWHARRNGRRDRAALLPRAGAARRAPRKSASRCRCSSDPRRPCGRYRGPGLRSGRDV